MGKVTNPALMDSKGYPKRGPGMPLRKKAVLRASFPYRFLKQSMNLGKDALENRLIFLPRTPFEKESMNKMDLFFGRGVYFKTKASL